jgi:hypothetical protein
MLTFIKSLFEDNSGGNSSARMVMLIWGIGAFLVWSILSLIAGTILSMPESILVIILATMGIKVAQRIFGEKTE